MPKMSTHSSISLASFKPFHWESDRAGHEYLEAGAGLSKALLVLGMPVGQVPHGDASSVLHVDVVGEDRHAPRHELARPRPDRRGSKIPIATSRGFLLKRESLSRKTEQDTEKKVRNEKGRREEEKQKRKIPTEERGPKGTRESK